MLRLASSASRSPAQRLAAQAARRTFASSSARRQDITLTVDGKEVTVPQGTALIQACEAAGSNVPRFCYHDRYAQRIDESILG
ncbi:hypothetical protein FRC08_013553 [Ceratobasidium sp. 394]|nr:hypothetical protein FRC08_013553 [Ceratobasidium sp. 394]